MSEEEEVIIIDSGTLMTRIGMSGEQVNKAATQKE